MLSTSFSKTVDSKRYTLAQWQQNPPDGKTSLSKTFGSTKCGKCCKFDSSIVFCTRSRNVDIFCQGCWDEADWQCPGCNTIPDDSEVVGCEQCGQWVHNNCSVFLDVTDGYVCTGCQSSDTLLLKAQLYTKEVELNTLATERKKMLTKLQTTTLKLTDSESKFSQQQSRYTTLEKRNQRLTSVAESVEKQLNKSQNIFSKTKKAAVQKISELEKQLNKSQNIFSNTKKAAVQKISELETTVVALKNSLKNCRAQYKQKRAEADTANVKKNEYKQRLTNNMEKNRKRQEDIDNLTQHMATFIEKGRTEWSDMMPAGLNEKESRLWSILKCKSRSLNGAVQFSADTNARFATYQELFKDILLARKNSKRNSKRKAVDLTTELQLPINSGAKRQRTGSPGPVSLTSENELSGSGDSLLDDDALAILPPPSQICNIKGADKYQQAAFKTWFEEDVTTGKDDTSVLHEDRCRPAPKSVHKLFAMWCAKNVKPMMVDRGRKMRFGEAMKSMQGVELKNSGKTHRGVIKKMNDSRKSDNSDSYFSGIIAIKGYGNKPITKNV